MTREQFEIKINSTKPSKLDQVDWDNLPFGKVFSDHMLVMDYSDGAWQIPVIESFENLSMHPATSVLHYGQTIFEGLKATKTETGEILIFRPDMNAERFMESCDRMCMPQVPKDVFVECIRKLVELDRKWIPDKEGFSLYIRPFIMATDGYIGIKPSDTYKFIIFTCPVGAYYSKPVNVKIEEHFTRAAEGGVGRAKTAGNYAASLYPAKLANEEGFDQLLWTDGKTHQYFEESGTMNVMFIIDNVLVTPSEESDTILRGITKKSFIEIARNQGYKVEERQVSVQEVIEAIRANRLQDAFGIGTAATIAHIAKIGFRDEVFELPPVESRTVSNEIKNILNDLKQGKIKDNNGWCLRVK